MDKSEKRVSFLGLSAYFAVVCIASGWGAATVALFLIPAPALKPAGRVGATLAVALVLAFLVTGLAVWLHRKLGKSFLLFQAAILALLALSLGAGEAWLRSGLAPWPARVLHGKVSSSATDRLKAVRPKTAATNSWGQRDKERAKTPEQGVTRVALLGGAFLEEGVLAPLSRLVDERVGRPYEFVNLGVSGSSPREIFWRAKDIALPLGAERLIVFFDPTEDFIAPLASEKRLLPHLARLVADHPPRGSLLGEIFPGLIQRLLPMGGDANPLERDLTQRLKKGRTEEILALLTKLTPTAKRDEMAERLGKADLKRLARALALPDLGLVRPAFLQRLLASLSWERGNGVSQENLETTARWLAATLRLGRRAGLETTLVLIPPAEATDDRLRDLWSSVGDIRVGARQWTEAADWLKNRLGDQTDVLDLREAFAGVRGTYLNGDGHWTPAGNEIASLRLAERFGKTPAPTTTFP